MAVAKNSLNLLKEEELTEEVRKYFVLYDKSHKGYMEKDAVNKKKQVDAKKRNEFLENGTII